MSAKTGSSYTTGTTTGSVKLPTASLEFSTMARQNKVSPNDCDNGRQPKTAMWPSKPEILIYLVIAKVGFFTEDLHFLSKQG